MKVLDWKHWLLGVLGGLVGGFSTSILSALGISGAEMVGVNVPQLTPRQFMIVTLFGGLSGAALYLRQSPVPREIEVETTTFVKVDDKSVTVCENVTSSKSTGTGSVTSVGGSAP